MVILDTNILIDALRRKNEKIVLEAILQTFAKEDLALSVISIQELYQGKSIEDPDKERNMQNLLAFMTIVPYPYDVAKRAGEIVREKNYGIAFADAAIAATAIVNGAQLATRNSKDFAGIANLELLQLKK